jgi:hypothetical protein
MKSFNQYLSEQKLFEEYLEEKLIMLSNGKKYGQIVFLAGGAGSGKGFASDNFMQKELFKVRDVDEWKKTFMALADIKDNPEKHAKMKRAGSKIPMGKYAEIKGLDLKKPEDVEKLHFFIKKLGIKDNTLNIMLGELKNKTVLPNIMFDITAKGVKDIKDHLPRLLIAGYNPANIHLVWVLTNYKIAVKQNAERERVVPADIMLQTHQGAADTVFKYVTGHTKRIQINGAIHVILNNADNTIFWDKSGADKTSNMKKNGKIKVSGDVVKDFTYLTIKKRGKPMSKESDVMTQFNQWVVDNIPKGELQRGIEQSQDVSPRSSADTRNKQKTSTDTSTFGVGRRALAKRKGK